MTMATSADPRPRSSKRVSELRLADTEISSPNRQTCSSFPLPRGTSIMFFCASCSNTWPSQTQLFPEPPTESCGAGTITAIEGESRLVVRLPAHAGILTRPPVPRGCASAVGRRFADWPAALAFLVLLTSFPLTRLANRSINRFAHGSTEPPSVSVRAHQIS